MCADNIQCFDDNTISIYELLLIIKKRVWTIGIVTVISIAIFSVYAYFSPKVYKTSNILIQKILFSQEEGPIDNNLLLRIKWILMNLNAFPKKQKAEKLGVDSMLIESVKDIKIAAIEGNAIKIDVDTFDQGSGVKIIDALAKFANFSQLVQVELNVKKELLIKTRIDLINTIEKPQTFLNQSDQVIVSDALSSIFFLKKELNRISGLINMLEEGELLKLAEITVAPKNPYKPKRSVLIFIGSIAGLFFGVLLGFFLEWLIVARFKYEQQNIKLSTK